MSPRKDQPPLFELLSEEESARKLRVPPWMQQRPEAEPKVAHTGFAGKARARGGTRSRAHPRGLSGGWRPWLAGETTIRVSRWVLLVAGVFAVFVVLLAYELGGWIEAGRPAQDGGPSQVADGRSALQKKKAKPANPELLQTSGASQPTSAASGGAASGGQAKESSGRKPGRFYYQLETFPAKTGDYKSRVQQFLEEDHGVEATVDRSGDNYQLIVTEKGFRSRTSERAKQYATKLKALGREWSSKYNGTDWSETGLFLKKYTGE